MRIGIIGAGFTGLTAALRLSQKGHEVVLYEKEEKVGGLALGFKETGWEWSAERAYHHWFTNDIFAINLAKELSHNIIVRRPRTDVFIHGKCLPFDSALSLLTFPYLAIPDRLKTGMGALFLKIIDDYTKLEGKRALPWIAKYMGEAALKTIWDPLFTGKFGQYKEEIALTWFWARIKKRTERLAYPQGGFQLFAERIAAEIVRQKGKIYLSQTIDGIKNEPGKVVMMGKHFDKVIVTLPSPVFAKIVKLPDQYATRITSIRHLHALNLVLILKKPFMEKTYWLNITEKNFPFLVLAQHTNFMDPKYYGNQHIVYVGNYLERDHRFFLMSKEELLKEFDPFLRKINPIYHSSLITYHSFVGPFAQPIVTTDYKKLMPTFETPIKNVFLANLDMVYPWDRGTNYAIELGLRIADLIA